MGVVDRKQELFEHIVRLRRVGREVPGNDDISAVRLSLERELGETVSRRMAARVLGVSHTALGRWIASGDLPVVLSAAGRIEIPVPALIELRESVDTDRVDRPRRYALAPTMSRNRTAAERMRIDDLKGPEHSSGHGRASARSLAYHRVVARRLRRPMVDEARHVLYRWREQGRIDAHYADQWADVLDQSVPAIRRTLVEESSEADDLRQNSPFAGALSEAERRRIISEVR